MLRAEGVLSVFPELTSAIEVESVVAAGPRIARERVQVFPVCVKTAALLGGLVWSGLISAVSSVLLTKREAGGHSVVVVDILESTREKAVATIIDELQLPAATTMQTPAPEDSAIVVSVSRVPWVLRYERVAAVEFL